MSTTRDVFKPYFLAMAEDWIKPKKGERRPTIFTFFHVKVVIFLYTLTELCTQSAKKSVVIIKCEWKDAGLLN